MEGVGPIMNTKVKIFEADSADWLTDRINSWLRSDHERHFTLIDIKYSYNEAGISAMAIYQEFGGMAEQHDQKAKDEPELAGTFTDTSLPRVHIEDWRIVGVGMSPSPSSEVLTGKVTDHPRFDAGTQVTTSSIQVRPTRPKKGDSIRTRNTVYILGDPA